MAKIVIAFVIPLLVLALFIPLVLGKVPPNNAYGFRTPKTLSSPDIWYPANRVAGWFMGAAALISLCINLALWWAFPDWPLQRTVWWMTAGTLGPLAVAVGASFVYLGRL